MPTRPNPFSALAPYTSWSSLTDRTLHRAAPAARVEPALLPPEERSPTCSCAAARATLCPKSTVMFAYFAQWFTDGFLRTRPQRRA